jgi:hypothetical protein
MPKDQNNSKLLDKAKDECEYIEYVAKGLRAAYGRKASRVYSILRDEFKPNVSGNLRGQIQNAEARIMHGRFHVVVERLEKATVILLFVQNLVEFEPRFEEVENSNAPLVVKGSQYAGMVSNALLKAFSTSALSDAETISMAVRFGLHRLSRVAGGKQTSKMVDTIARIADSADANLNHAINDVFDPDKQAIWVRHLGDSLAR